MTDVRNAIVGWGRWGVAHHDEFTYTENGDRADGPVRQSILALAPGKGPVTTDCSGWVTLCYKWAGAPAPDSFGYTVLGYTGTLLDAGTLIPLSEVLPGDVIVYGPGTGWHTALIIEAGPDPLTSSLGQQGDPSFVRVSQDGRLPQRYLRFDTTSKLLTNTAPPAAVPTAPPTGDNVQFLAKSFDGPATLLYDTQTQTCIGVSAQMFTLYTAVGIKNYGDTLNATALATFRRVG